MHWKISAAVGSGGFAFFLYFAWKSWIYFNTIGDITGFTILGVSALIFLLAAGFHWYMAVGFKVGRLNLVTGSLSSATLWRGDSIVIATTKIQFIRKLNVDNLNLAEDKRFVFFLSSYRPWVCTEKNFQVL
ncbi:hypothetical protein [Comamonas composti]|uniref:hypothetical protein n=1 Tax=Comamonas composti TaxID=408558 RepID=UPI0012EBBBAD|nr:hypothetical protein [Comamonas composti]